MIRERDEWSRFKSDIAPAGHSLGHYLSACSMMYQTTGDKRFLERLNYIVVELKFLQDADGEGYTGAFPNGKNIFYHNDNELFVFQFIASVLTWKEKGIILTQKTSFPEEQGSQFEFKCEKPVNLTLQVRFPAWAKNGIEIKVNDLSK